MSERARQARGGEHTRMQPRPTTCYIKFMRRAKQIMIDE